MQPDKDGYYHVVVGGYPEGLRPEVFEKFQNRCRSQLVFGEWGRPIRPPHQPFDDFVARMRMIDDNKAAFKILDATVTEDRKIACKIQPAGPFHRHMEEVLAGTPENPEVSVKVFGMRGTKRNGDFTEILTWDLVDLPNGD